MAKAAQLPMDEFARQRVEELLDRLDAQVTNVSRQAGPEAIHDLRVSIRRLTQALRALKGLFSKRRIEPMRRDLRAMMNVAAEIRNRDIALELLQEAGVDPGAKLRTTLAGQRDSWRDEMSVLARRWRRRKIPVRWKALIA